MPNLLSAILPFIKEWMRDYDDTMVMPSLLCMEFSRNNDEFWNLKLSTLVFYIRGVFIFDLEIGKC